MSLLQQKRTQANLWALFVVRTLEVQTYLILTYWIKNDDVKRDTGTYYIDDVKNIFEEETLETKGLIKNSQEI